MFTSLLLPEFPLQVQLSQNPGWRWEPVGVLDTFSDSGDALATGSRQPPVLLSLTTTAAEAGVEKGMTAAQGQARCGHLHVLTRDRDREGTTQERLLTLAASLSADFESTAPGLVTIDLGAVPGISREELLLRLGNEWIADLAEDELEARVGFAPHPDLAALAARIEEEITIFQGNDTELLQQLAPHPLTLLPLPPDLFGTLTLWGLQTLGDFSSLPRDEVAERLGPEAAGFWDRAAGKGNRLLTLLRPPVDFQVEIDFENALDTLEPLMFRLRRSLETLAARLAGVYLATSEIQLLLRLSDGSASEQIIRVPEANRDVDRLFSLVHTRLETLSLHRPIEGYRLRLQSARSGEHPYHLFETALRDPNRFADTLAQIEALVGTENAGSPVPKDSHRPDSFEMRPFDPEDGTRLPGRKSPEDFLSAVQGLPLRRFRPPRPLEVDVIEDPASGRARPVAVPSGEIRGRFCHLAGPWPLSGDWWESAQRWRREEWDVQLEDGSLYRLSCHLEEDDSPSKRPAWYLEGVYG